MKRYTPDPTRPLEMTESTWLVLCRLTDERRTEVLERASIIHSHCPGLSWAEADERALAEVLGIPTQKVMAV